MADLFASRVKGSARQLFGGSSDKENGNDFLIRPKETRKQHNLALSMGDMILFILYECNCWHG